MQIFRVRTQDVLVNMTRNVDNVNMDKILSGDINKTEGLQISCISDRDQVYDTDIPSVHIDFGRDANNVIKPK